MTPLLPTCIRTVDQELEELKYVLKSQEKDKRKKRKDSRMKKKEYKQRRRGVQHKLPDVRAPLSQSCQGMEEKGM